MSNNRIIKSYVWHNRNVYFVSTIERDSSAAEGPRRFNETLVWAYDWNKAERGDLLYTEGDDAGSIRKHQFVCEQLFNGNYGFQWK